MTTLTHHIIGRGVSSFGSFPEAADLGISIVDMVWDSLVYKDAPCSIGTPTLNPGDYAFAFFTSICDAIDFDLKFNNGGSALNVITLYYTKNDGSTPQIHIAFDTASFDWTHYHQDLPSRDEWMFLFLVHYGDSAAMPQGWIDNIEFTPTLILTGQQTGPVVQDIPCGDLSLAGNAPIYNGQWDDVPCGELVLVGFCPASGPMFADVPCGELALSGLTPSYTWLLSPAPKPYGYTGTATPTPKSIYTLTLTGGIITSGTPVSGESASGTSGFLAHTNIVPGSLSFNGFVLTSDLLLAPWYAYDDAAGIIRGPGGVYLGTIDYTAGAWNVAGGIWIFGPTSASYQYSSSSTPVADVVIPMSSFTLRLRNGDPSYLNAVIPDSVTWQAAISARTTGDLILKKGYLYADGTQVLEALTTVDFESVAIDRGGRSDSATLVGHRTTTYSSPVTRTISGVTNYSLQADGTRRVRAPVDTFLRPGDTCVYGSGVGESFVVGEIEYIVDTDLAYMEVKEEEED